MKKFKPGMKCPGWQGNAFTCNAVLESKEDQYERRLLCHGCGRDEQTYYQRQHRHKSMHKCADCPKMCGDRAERCRVCGQRKAKAEALQTAREAKQAPKVPTVAYCPTGLRGPGGALEHPSEKLSLDPARARVVDAAVARWGGR